MLLRATIQFVVMLVVGIVFLSLGHTIPGAIVIGIGLVLTTLAVLAPSAYQTIQELMVRLGALVSTGIGAVLLTLVYFTVFAAGSGYLRLRGKDPLDRKTDAGRMTNWIDRDLQPAPSTYAKQYSLPHHSEAASSLRE